MSNQGGWFFVYRKETHFYQIMWPFKSKPNPKLEALKAHYESLRPRMFEPRRRDQDDRIELVTAVSKIIENGNGRMAIAVELGYRSMAVHEVNKDGTFSKKLPYWTAAIWKGPPAEDGRFALVTMAVSKNRGGFKTSNRDSNSLVDAIGIQIHEMDTHRLPNWTWEEYERMRFFANPYKFGK